MRNSALIKFLIPAVLAVSLLSVYLATMAPGLTWANDGADGGDLITAAATGGIAHPTGYPLYLLVARVFQFLPVGSLAFRTNLMSVFAAVSASLFVYGLVIRFIPSSAGIPPRLVGLISAYAFGLSPLFWSQAVITEVYALHALFVALILYLASDHAHLKFPPKYLDPALGLSFGLALGNHITIILLLPILFLPTLFQSDAVSLKRFWQPDKASFLRRLSWMLAGLSVYLILPLRALSGPPINWGNPRTISGFIWLVSGKLYQDQLFVLTLASVWSRIRSMAGLLIGQFGIPGLVLGLVGLIVFYKPSRLFRNTIWIVLASSVFAIGYETSDSYVYLIPAFLCFAIWVGVGAAGLLDLCPRQVRFALGVSLVLYIFVLAGNNWVKVDASRDLRAETFGHEVLSQAPENAMVFAQGDKAIFTMWYFHFALHNRPDLRIVVTDLLRFDWYQASLQTTYPGLTLPGPFPFAAVMQAGNPERPSCFIEYIEKAGIECQPAQVSRTP